MAHSVGSAPSSMGSNGSKRFSRRYRTVAYRSEVDETLFGQPNRVKQANEMKSVKEKQQQQANSTSDLQQKQNNYQHKSAGPFFGGPSSDRSQQKASRSGGPPKEFIKHITKDLIREILVPEQAAPKSVVIDKDTYGRLIKACRHRTKEDIENEKAIQSREQDQLVKELHERKKMIQKYDAERKKNEQLEEVDELAKAESEYLLKKANELRQEQEDEVKRLNELILNVKVHAIRDAQVQEKQQVKKEIVTENQRLDQMMEVDRLNAIKIQEEIEKKRKQDMHRGAKVILKQIDENRQEKLLKDEMREQENAAMLTYLEQLQKDDFDEMQKRKVDQKKLAKDLLVANRQMEDQRELRKQQDIVADLKVIEYQKDKAAKDAAYEAEQERKRAEKEKEVARMRALQERAHDLQAEKDTLRAKREQERREREWREKERQEMIKKKNTEEEMRLAREWQIQNKEHFLAVEASKDRSEFQKVLRAQLELAEKERDSEERAQNRARNYTQTLQNQIRSNEQIKIAERKAFFEEGIKLDDEARQRRARLDEIKRKKLDELKNAGIPEKYCTEIERKINGPKKQAART